ncbi:adenylate kinase family protein [Kitasatospora purpeofusca]|uniref:adenylate kinase family protein n=1 Tax=Kitasatospora purpeofusca TaxID=67352 RepID=UPI0035DF4D15
MRVVLFHSPEFWREVPAASLAEALAVPQIRFSDLLRTHLSRRTELGIRVARIFDSREPVPDEIVTAIVRDRLHRLDHADFLLVGHPLNTAQALALDELLRELGKPVDRVLHLRLPEAEAERRVRLLTGRRLCRTDSGHVFEPSVDLLLTDEVGNVCNVCGGELCQRVDDNENTIRSRSRAHEAMLAPITRYYAEQGLLVTVDALGTSDETTGRALAALRVGALVAESAPGPGPAAASSGAVRSAAVPSAGPQSTRKRSEGEP